MMKKEKKIIKRRKLKQKKNIKMKVKKKKKKNSRKIKSTKNEIAKNIKKSIKKRIIIFNIRIIILNLFSLYYASCFGALYNKTQKYLFIDFLLSIPMGLASCLISCLFYLLIKLIIKNGDYSCISNYNNISLLLNLIRLKNGQEKYLVLTL